MAVSALGGSRRAKVMLIAAVQIVLILYFGFTHSGLADVQEKTPSVPGWHNPRPGTDSAPVQAIPESDGDSSPPAQVELPHTRPPNAPQTHPPVPPATTVTDTDTATETEAASATAEAPPSFTSYPHLPGGTVGGDFTTPAGNNDEVCEGFEALQQQRPGPASKGRRKFPYVRPKPKCRKFKLPAMEALIDKMRGVIADPDLFRLFENSFPNTLDTMVKWRGFANVTDEITGETRTTDEELTYVITGDIDAMWLRDSASQIYSYVSLLEPSPEPDSLASLWRGLINSHARYLIISPYCHSFQPPAESGIKPTRNDAYSLNNPQPAYNPSLVFDCKWELDSLASFLQISAAYYERTRDLAFFGKYRWKQAVKAAVHAAAAMRRGTYDANGKVLPSAWTFTGYTNRGSETLTNDGLGNPVRENGMVRSGFRPSDDACIFQLLTPSNMMFAAYLEQASVMMEGLADDGDHEAANLTMQMRELAGTIRYGVARDAVVRHREFGDIFAYEVDGYGGANLMDDANVPSLLALPFWNYTQPKKKTTTGKSADRRRRAAADAVGKAAAEEAKHDFARIYQNTRKFVLSMANPYFAQGPVLSAVGGPHLGPGRGWPMAATVAALTAYDDLAGIKAGEDRAEVVGAQLRMILDSTDGKGVIHETVNAWAESAWTRSWFGWANGMFGELVLRIARDEEERGVKKEDSLLGRSWQEKKVL
jgi:meiotically up-regulated gene 157 (Mug157) protein